MLDDLCKLNMEFDPLPDLPWLTVPPESIHQALGKPSSAERSVLQLAKAAAANGLELSFDEMTEMTDTQRANQVRAFRGVFVNAYALPFEKEDYGRMIRNTALNVMTDPKAKPETQLKAAEILGKTTPVQAFAPDIITILTDKSLDELRHDLKAKLAALSVK